MNKKELASLLVKDNYTVWKELLYTQPKYKDQLHMLLKAYPAGSVIPVEDLAFIRKGFKEKFTFDEIKLYTKVSLCKEQKQEIFEGIEMGLAYDEVEFYAKPYFNSKQMQEIRLALNNYQSHDVEFFARTDFTHEQMHEIRLALESDDIKISDVKKYAKPEFDSKKLKLIYHGLKFYSTTIVDMYADNRYSAEQMEIIKKGLDNDLLKEAIAIYANPELNVQQMKAIFDALKGSNICLETVKRFAKPQYHAAVMKCIYNAILQYAIDTNMLDMCINFVEDVDCDYVTRVVNDLKEGLSFEKLVEIFEIPQESIKKLEKDIYDLL